MAYRPSSVIVNTMTEEGDVTFGPNDKATGRIRLNLTPELQRPFAGFVRPPQYSHSAGDGGGGGEGGGGGGDGAVSAVEWKRYRNLRCQVALLEESNGQKSAIIEHLQLYSSDKLTVIDSLAEALADAKWKRDEMRRMCDEHAGPAAADPEARNRLALFMSHRQRLQYCLFDLEHRTALEPSLADAVQHLKSGLDKCVGVIDGVVADRRDLPDTATVPSGFDGSIETISRLRTALDGGGGDLVIAQLWNIVKDLYRSNGRLANRALSLNVHRAGLRTQLDEARASQRRLEAQAAEEAALVKAKRDTLDHNESLVRRHWDRLDTSQEIVEQTRRAQRVDQELEDIQIAYDNLDQEKRQLKTNLSHYENELIQYQLKCEQMEKYNKQLEKEKNNLLEAYAKSWGHYNEKQKIKYTGRLIKDINNINQEIRSYEVELGKYENNNFNIITKTPVFSKTQPKSDKTPRSFGIIDVNKQQNTNGFRDTVIRNYQFQ